MLEKKKYSHKWTAKGKPATKKNKNWFFFLAGKMMGTVFWDSREAILI